MEKIFAYKDLIFWFRGTGFRNTEKLIFNIGIPKKYFCFETEYSAWNVEDNMLDMNIPTENYILHLVSPMISELQYEYRNDKKDAREKAQFAVQNSFLKDDQLTHGVVLIECAEFDLICPLFRRKVELIIMRYTEIDLQCEDIMWFGIDQKGYVFMCTSGGCGNIPEFICKCKENVGILEEFFLNELQKSTESVRITKKKNDLVSDALALSEKGIFCFDALLDEKEDGTYSKITAPLKPLRIDDLPINIQEILVENQVDVDVTASQVINVQHAY